MQKLRLALVAVPLLLACGDKDGFEIEPEQLARIEEAFEDLNENAPERVRELVLQTCDAWYHIDRPCVDEEVRVAQLECWLEGGKVGLQEAEQMRLGPWSRDGKIMRKQKICMWQRRWRMVGRRPRRP